MTSGTFRSGSRFLALLGLTAGLFLSIPTPAAEAVNDVQASCVIGSSSSCPAQSPQEIFNLYGTTANGTYWLNVNGVATQTYLILDTSYPDGGMWFLGMKGTKTGGSFWYDSTNWTSQSTTLNVTSLSNDVAAEAKFNAYNYLPVTKVLGVFKDRSFYNFSSSGTGSYNPNSFGGHVWKEDITSQTMYSRFNTNSILYNASGTLTRYELYRESNSSSANLVFAYQNGYAKYGFAYSSGSATYRWGIAFNNETTDGQIGSSDAQAGIGLSANSAASVYTYPDSSSYAVNGSTGANNGTAVTYASGFQIWGKMAAPSLATPGALTVTNQGSGSVQLSFAASSGATEYAIQYKTAGSNWNTGTTVRLTNPGATPSATLTGISSGSYDFRVFARASNNSSSGNSYLLTQSIDATAPTITGPSSATGSTATISIAENTTSVHTFTANETVSWAKSGIDSGYFAISSGGVLTITVRDFESPADDGSNNTYIVAITATDASGNTRTQTLTVTITNVNEAPMITVANSSPTAVVSRTENITNIFTYTGSDSDTASNLTWSISGTDVSFFAIDSSTGALTFLTARDFEAPADSDGNNTYIVTLTLSDGALSDSQTLTVTVTNVNESASINSPTTSGVLSKGVATTISVTTNAAGKVRFFVGNKRISTCLARPTSGSYPTFIATCSWRPAVTGRQSLTASVTPSDNTFSSSTSSPTVVQVVKRTSSR